MGATSLMILGELRKRAAATSSSLTEETEECSVAQLMALGSVQQLLVGMERGTS